jgi:DeoR/GlpR family transcriptional regulator of sugar metabolism
MIITSPPRFTQERHARIVEWLNTHGRVEVLELARTLTVSEHTIRRDLEALQAAGMLQRTHGGAVAIDTKRLDYGGRAAVLADVKGHLGQAAAAHIEAGQSVVIDAGSTNLAMARALTVRPLTVITNSLDVAAVFDRDPLVQLVVLGGVWQPDARAFWGHATTGMLALHRADWAVPGACAVDVSAGVTASEEPDAMLKQAMVKAARRTMVLADHSKVGGVAPYRVADWSQVHTLVTDRAWPELEAQGVGVAVAGG